ncbi:LytTR family transcriptional regulator DNA-binding domain-containing protein [Paenibacillus sp. CF384]|uniref:LytTR family transcriptional regulator DNA-binding domain-containing protein n=1 Tax=Paenibacillus sp. CF384 TaxID=1884382 RepID=UPI000897E27E|nr:LytTR family transcriptional regulator DNA-binding domain-containing protein [Paenibacillus sp. CF384]SDX21417.1 LytTr DNA-binding domain-containing protein [Paenibacillus sp. CF384]
MQLLLLNKNGEKEWVPMDKICFVSHSSKGPKFMTKSGASYQYPQTMEQVMLVFGPFGYERLDRNVVVNMAAAVSYNPVERNVYFDDTAENGSGLYATVSGANVDKVKHLIIRENEGVTYATSAA